MSRDELDNFEEFRRHVAEYTSAQAHGEPGRPSRDYIVRALLRHPEWREHAQSSLWNQAYQDLCALIENVLGGLRVGPIRLDINTLIIPIRPGTEHQANALLGAHVDVGGFHIQFEVLPSFSS